MDFSSHYLNVGAKQNQKKKHMNTYRLSGKLVSPVGGNCPQEYLQEVGFRFVQLPIKTSPIFNVRMSVLL